MFNKPTPFGATEGVDWIVPTYIDEVERTNSVMQGHGLRKINHMAHGNDNEHPAMRGLDHNEHLNQFVRQEEGNIDKTIWGHNYLGPGTKVVSNILSGMKPTDTADENALIHDFEYLKADDYSDIIRADNTFNRNNLTLDLESVLAEKALKIKNNIGLMEQYWNTSRDMLDSDDIARIEKMMNKILDNSR